MKMEPAPGVPVYGIVVEKDVDVPMRDGARLKADVFRPDDPGTFPAILNLGPYQKDKLWVPPGNLEEKPNPLMNCFIRAHFRSPVPSAFPQNTHEKCPSRRGFSLQCLDTSFTSTGTTCRSFDGHGQGMDFR